MVYKVIVFDVVNIRRYWFDESFFDWILNGRLDYVM